MLEGDASLRLKHGCAQHDFLAEELQQEICGEVVVVGILADHDR